MLMFQSAFAFVALGLTHAWWDAGVQRSLLRAPAQRAGWESMLRSAPVRERQSLAYLLRYMPLADLKNLPPAQLEENVRLALRAHDAVAWSNQIPHEVFLDAVLPYACVTEPRDSMRAEFLAKYLKAVRSLKSPGEAAQYLNHQVFADTHVVYNTRRRTTDQAPRDTIAQRMATCTGLSILLIDACRAVGIPARIAGINSWPGKGGNHTWVEVWDQGWHFIGAGEPDPKGLDHAWFVGDAAKAIKSKPMNAVFAVTYRPTGSYFPLEWAPGVKMNGENVTDRYTRSQAPSDPRLMVDVRTGSDRVIANVVAIDAKTGQTVISGMSCGPRADTNNFLTKPVVPGTQVLVTASYGGTQQTQIATVDKDMVIRFDLSKGSPMDLKPILSDRFGADPAKAEVASKLLANIPYSDGLKAQVWEAFKSSPLHETMKLDFSQNRVATPERTSPYRWRTVGQKPAEGWGLVIAMHGGGNVAKEENDAEWNGMFEHYYHDHPEKKGYIYLALRAPNDTWNGFYDDAIAPLIERLILQFELFADVDPKRVYALGASHGGYGAFVIGPKIPWRFAAVHASAAAPTEGETEGENLRNLRFTWMVGENDKDYGRAERAQEFAGLIDKWKAKDGGFPGEFELVKHTGHFVPDHDKLAEMTSYVRESFPKHLVWVMSDDVLHDFYWIHVPHPKKGARIEAIVEGNTITIQSTGLDSCDLRLDSRLLDLSMPVKIMANGMPPRSESLKPSIETYCSTLDSLGDPDLAVPAQVIGITLSQ